MMLVSEFPEGLTI